ncbi:bis(5'-nucleosyl)-tetraphosphatase (symmetrical) YqeK [Sulfoacidibacillus ferrooxidans]|uniref:bis(5'-nucleosyl)-tetraphosphatase (symmetrical) n=1 Tax=Sulfoacidibacillus ferrooxidans TaxID=2005001 RepID=A0A9X2AC55_9BACL|nr:bis(5'-nucleosyl)-tetraphosphatase (symmetrical) YqeK [Sulfoacidibacillus ferrooxidans]MCI0181915.1 hypothetical protein [Sulfoacidibacillus ferrooxidans]
MELDCTTGGVSAIVNDWYSLVKSRLTPKRFKHVEGVVYTAKLLAKQFGVDENQAMIAAWLHDIYRELDVETLTRLALEVDVTVPTTAPVTWHGPIAAKRLPLDFAVFDQEIQDAIASHTLGHPQMSAVAQVLYVADAIEPGRSYAGVDELRLAAQKSLPYAVACVADSAILFLVKQHLPICWETVEMRNQLWLGIDETN